MDVKMDEVMPSAKTIDMTLKVMGTIDDAMRAMPDQDKTAFVMAVMDAMFYGHKIRPLTSNAIVKAVVAAIEHWDEPATEKLGSDAQALWRFGDLLAENWRE